MIIENEIIEDEIIEDEIIEDEYRRFRNKELVKEEIKSILEEEIKFRD